MNWIKTSDRTPEEGANESGYITVLTYNGIEAYISWYNKPENTWHDWYGDKVEFPEITHWMPLPEPPNQ